MIGRMVPMLLSLPPHLSTIQQRHNHRPDSFTSLACLRPVLDVQVDEDGGDAGLLMPIALLSARGSWG